MKKARLWYRYWAWFEDTLVVTLASIPLLIVLSFLPLYEDGFFFNVGIGVYFIVISLWYNVHYLTKTGATPGKKAFGIKVVHTSGRLLTTKEVILREFVKSFIILIPLGRILYFLNFVIIIFSKNRQGIHDRAVKSIATQVGEPAKSLKIALVLLFIVLIILILFFLYSMWHFASFGFIQTPR